MSRKNTSAIDKREVRQIRKDLEKIGFSTRRQPGSGNRAIDLQHDVFWRDSPIGPLHIEDKYREEPRWKVMLGWKQGAEILTMRSARDERYCFMKWDLFLDFMREHARLVGLANEGRAHPDGNSSDDCTPQPVSEGADSAGIGTAMLYGRHAVDEVPVRYNAPQSLLTGKPKPKRQWKRKVRS